MRAKSGAQLAAQQGCTVHTTNVLRPHTTAPWPFQSSVLLFWGGLVCWFGFALRLQYLTSDSGKNNKPSHFILYWIYITTAL